MEETQKKVHFIGIGGIGMSGIAEVLHNMGYQVSGSDIRESHVTQKLSKIGVTVYIGHHENNVSDVDVVVYSNAVPDENPEIIRAKNKSIPIIPRAEMLNELLRIKRGIGIAGTHGKTSTTSMVSFILNEAKWDPTMIIGGILNTIKSNAYLGKGEFLIYEACEAFGSINYLNGEIVALTNIDDDHMDCYKDFDDLKNTFLSYINRIPFYGFAALNGDDENIKSLIPHIRKKFYLFGFDPEYDVYAYDIKRRDFRTIFKVKYLGEYLDEFEISLPGIHNVYNALAAITIAKNLGVETKVIKKSLSKFINAKRRFEFIGEKDGVMIVDDYAHHPTEVEATLDAALQTKNGKVKRVVTIFQPHLYSRTQVHYKNFALTLKKSDYVFLLELYPAREKAIPGVSSKLIEDRFIKGGFGNYNYCKGFEDLLSKLPQFLKEGDLVITMGAGDVTNLGPKILEQLKKNDPSLMSVLV